MWAVPGASTVTVETPEPGIAQITLSRPERLNALSPELVVDPQNALDEVEGDRSQRAVILTGAGRGFCSAADLKAGAEQELAEPPDRSRVLGTFTGNMAEASQAFREGREPRWNPL